MHTSYRTKPTSVIHVLIQCEKFLVRIALVSLMISLIKDTGFLKLSITHPIIFFLICSWLLRLFLNNDISALRLSLWELCCILFILWVLLSTLVVAPSSIGYAVSHVSLISFGLYARFNFDKTFDYRTFEKLSFSTLAFQVVLGLLQFLTHSHVGALSRYFGGEIKEIVEARSFIRPEGTFNHSNILGMWIVLLIFFVIRKLLLFYNDKKYRYTALTAFLCLSALLILIISVSRWNAVVFVCMFCVFLIVSLIRIDKKKIMQVLKRPSGVFSIMVLGVLILGFFGYKILVSDNTFFSSRLERIGRTSEDLEIRIQQYKLALRTIARRPIVGVGSSNADMIWQDVRGDFLLDTKFNLPHNFFILTAVESGLPGFFLLCLVIFIPLCEYLKGFFSYGIKIDIIAISVISFILLSLVYLGAAMPTIFSLFLFLLGSFMAYISDTLRKNHISEGVID